MRHDGVDRPPSWWVNIEGTAAAAAIVGSVGADVEDVVPPGVWCE